MICLRWGALALTGLVSVCVVAEESLVTTSAPLPPAEALASYETRPGFRVELAAAEPLVEDPVAIAWDGAMRLWVVEMRDYPSGLDGKGQPGSRIKVLEDTTGDWVYDRATLFLDGLSYAKGVMPWGNGALITCAPDILYAEDTTGDGYADHVETLYTGFAEGNPQHRVNSPRWGLDNWIYCANGDSGGHIVSKKTGYELPIRGRDFRIRPDTGALEGATGQTQFGRVRDDWGTWFGCTNWTYGWQYVLEDHYIRRNPHLITPPVRVDFTEETAVFAISPLQQRFNDFHMVNILTSACGLELYRDDVLGAAVRDNAFICEPVHNLVSRLVLDAEGVVFQGERAPGEEEAEFFASRDNWARPVFARTGPDGALWIVDMYRYAIEHPDYINDEDAARTDFRAGSDMGRIYRIVPEDGEVRSPQQLAAKPTAALVAALDTANGEVRDLAHQQLLHRDAAEAAPLLADLVRSGALPEAKVQALGALAGLNALDPAILRDGLADPHPGVRRQALRLAEPFLEDGDPGLGTAVAALAEDEDPFVLQQVAYTLGAWHAPEGAVGLVRLLREHLAAPYIRAAALSAMNDGNFAGLTPAMLELARNQAPGAGEMEELVRTAVRFALHHGEEAPLELLVAAALEEASEQAPWPFMLLAEAYDAQVGGGARLEAALEGLDPDGAHRARLATAARAVAADSGAVPAVRIQAIRMHLRPGGDADEERALLAELVTPREPEEVFSAALEALQRRGGTASATPLLAQWSTLSPALRQRVFDWLASRGDGTDMLLAALDQGKVAPQQIDLPRRQRLLEHGDDAVRSRAEAVFAEMMQQSRAEALAAFEAAVTLPGDPEAGRPIFEERCATCHALGGVGHVVGPDLAALTDKSPRGLLAAILDPNQVVEEKYMAYEVTTADWLSLAGILQEETASSITLRAAGGIEQTILRSDIESFEASSLSLMPEGLEEGLEAQDMADLIAYVADRRLAPKRFPGNEPAPVLAEDDGALVCTAENAGIYGTTLVFQEDFSSLGEWASEDDHAAWTVTVPEAGAYRVKMEFCCDRLTAGNTWLLDAGGNQLTGQTRSTGTWNNYVTADIGEVQLEAGETTVTFRAFGPIEGTLIELRALRFVPK